MHKSTRIFRNFNIQSVLAGLAFQRSKTTQSLGPGARSSVQKFLFLPAGRYLTFLSAAMMTLASLSQCSLLGLEEEEDNSQELALLLVASSSSGCTYESESVTTTSSTGQFTLVDTAQTDCFNSTTGSTQSCSGSGQDGAYNSLTNTKQPSYSSNGNGTITDNNTGLTWTTSPDTNGDSTLNVSDKLTQLDAYNYCANLNYAGSDDWRLPTIKQLYSLMDFRGKDPSGYTGTSTSVLTPFLNDTYFSVGFGDQSAGERIIDGQYATTSVYKSKVFDTVTGMFGVNFVDGRIKGYPCLNSKTFYVLCVRGNTEYGKNNFRLTDSGATVTDDATGLVWQQSDGGTTRNFDDAISYCEGLSLAGQTDWRLPNIKELNSIVDYSRAPDTDSAPALNSIFTASSFSNEEGITDYGWYWSSTTHVSGGSNGTSNDGKNGAYQTFGRALGYYQNQLSDVHGAGGQRSNYKLDVSTTTGVSSINLGNGLFYYHGPQGDVLRHNNYVRCVRN